MHGLPLTAARELRRRGSGNCVKYGGELGIESAGTLPEEIQGRHGTVSCPVVDDAPGHLPGTICFGSAATSTPRLAALRGHGTERSCLDLHSGCDTPLPTAVARVLTRFRRAWDDTDFSTQRVSERDDERQFRPRLACCEQTPDTGRVAVDASCQLGLGYSQVNPQRVEL